MLRNRSLDISLFNDHRDLIRAYWFDTLSVEFMGARAGITKI